MLPAGFEPEIPASDRLQTHALDLVATGIGLQIQMYAKCCNGNQIMKNLLQGRDKYHV